MASDAFLGKFRRSTLRNNMILQKAQLVEAVHAHCHGQPMQNTRGSHAGRKNMAAPVGPWSLKMTQQQPWLSNCAAQPVCLNNPSCSQNAFRVITCMLPSQEYSLPCCYSNWLLLDITSELQPRSMEGCCKPAIEHHQ